MTASHEFLPQSTFLQLGVAEIRPKRHRDFHAWCSTSRYVANQCCWNLVPGQPILKKKDGVMASQKLCDLGDGRDGRE